VTPDNDHVFPTDERDGSERATVPAGLVLASIARRAGGAVIDQLLVFVPVAVGAVAYGYRPGDTLTDDALLVLDVATAVTAFAYAALLIGFFGRTVGKIATGTRVVRQVDGGRVGWFAAVERALVPVVFSSVPEIGLLLGALVYGVALLGPLRQGVHDRAAGTLVVRNGTRVVVTQ
jgi:uncharacterized RDD family membrane protein YckC